MVMVWISASRSFSNYGALQPTRQSQTSHTTPHPHHTTPLSLTPMTAANELRPATSLRITKSSKAASSDDSGIQETANPPLESTKDSHESKILPAKLLVARREGCVILAPHQAEYQSCSDAQNLHHFWGI